MRHKLFQILMAILSISLFQLFTPDIFAQSKVGTTIGQFLKIEPSARIGAMGNAGVSMAGEAISAYYNPASLGRLQNISVQYTYSEWIADIDYNFAAIALPVENMGTFMLNVISLNSGEIDVRTVSQEHGTGERYTVTDFSFGLGYGLMLTDEVSVGLQFYYFQETIWHSDLSGFGMNFGVQYQLYSNGPTIGASISNFGPRSGFSGRDLYIDYDFNDDIYGDNDQLPAELRTDEYALPTIFKAGISFPYQFDESYRLTLVVDALHPNDNNESINTGIESVFFNNYAIRGGYRNLFLPNLEGGLTLGGGVKVQVSGYELIFDYAWADYGILKQTQRFSLGLGF